MAVLLNARFSPAGSVPLAKGTLALLPIEGSALRPVLQNVQYACKFLTTTLEIFT
jgi:hypothetical protein